jgi:hypothetical protein
MTPDRSPHEMRTLRALVQGPAAGAAGLLLLLSGIVNAAPDADYVTSLPGWEGKLPSSMYSGYLDIPGGKHLHYVFVESEQVGAEGKMIGRVLHAGARDSGGWWCLAV